MKIENLTLTNFNQREFKIHTYVLDQNPELVEQKRPLAIVVPGGSSGGDVSAWKTGGLFRQKSGKL